MTTAWTWIDPDGATLNLMQDGYVSVLLGRAGAWMPPMTLSEDQIPLAPGATVRHVGVSPRPLRLPLLIQGSTPLDLEANKRTLLHLFDPRRGDGRLRLTADDGAERELVCRYASGLEMVEDGKAGFLTWQVAPLLLRGSDPLWYDASDSLASFALDLTASSFFPIFPLRLSASRVFAELALNNSGDAEAWPRWVVTGPGQDPILTNVTTGKRLAITRTLGTTESITIDTRPRIKTVVDQSGGNLFPYLSGDAQLWPLAQGANTIRIELPGATADSGVTVAWRRRWLGP